MEKRGENGRGKGGVEIKKGRAKGVERYSRDRQTDRQTQED